MTMSFERQRRKPFASGPARILGIGLFLFGILLPQYGRTATSERIVTDPTSGLAINGFDPVSYFVDAAAKFGRPDVEESYGGAIWRFRNVGNRAAFMARPDVYMPRFGGYDPVAVAEGKSVPGNPLFWMIKHERLYLFYSAQSRSAFAADPDYFIAQADRRWPEVEHSLTP